MNDRIDVVAQRRARQTVLDWTSDLDAGEREELEMLRGALGDRDGELDALRRAVEISQRRLNECCAALRLLERSRPWQRAAVWREIRCRGLLDPAGVEPHGNAAAGPREQP